jgi:hypothetical protein
MTAATIAITSLVSTHGNYLEPTRHKQPSQLLRFAEAVAQTLRQNAAAEIGLHAVGGRDPAARRSGGGESVLVELEQVVGGGQEAPFRLDGGSAAA